MAVTYGQGIGKISFAYCQTEINSAGAEMDPSGSDQKFTVIKLRVRAQLNPALYPNLNFDNKDPAFVLAHIRHYMTLPRQPLYYDLLSPPYQTLGPAIIDLPDGRDDAGGPIPDPDAFNATYTTPTNIEISWSVTVKLRDCDNAPDYMPLSFRWETGIEFDKYWKATYRQTGYVLFSSRSAITPDSFRRLNLAPQVLPGFAREQAHYKVSADGLRADFEFVDGQIKYAPPYPVVDMDIVQSESFPLPGGMRVGEITVYMKGLFNATPMDLEFWCFVVAWGRMQAADPLMDRKRGRILGQAVFSTHEAKDSLDATFTISYKVDPLSTSELRTSAAESNWPSWIVSAGQYIGNQINSPGPGAGAGQGGVQGGLLAGAARDALDQITQQGRITSRNQPFPWVGHGTSPKLGDISSFRNWAVPGGIMGGPPQGLPLADSVILFAAALRDPCGGQMPVMPNAQQIVTTVSRNPRDWNAPQGGAGRGGNTPSSTAQLTASVTQYLASMYPTTPLPPSVPSPYQDDPRPGVYELWQCSAEYTDNPGTIVVPTCDPNGVSKRIRYASTQWVLRVRWVAKRTGSWPMIPLKVLTDANWVYTGGTIPVRNVRMGADQVSYVYEASGVYEFMALDQSLVKLTAPIPPTLSTTEMQRVANWVDAALAGITTAQAQNLIAVGTVAGNVGSSVLTGGGGSPLGGGSFPGSPP